MNYLIIFYPLERISDVRISAISAARQNLSENSIVRFEWMDTLDTTRKVAAEQEIKRLNDRLKVLANSFARPQA